MIPNSNKISTYFIKKKYMLESICFNLISGKVNQTISYCTLWNHSSSPILLQNKEIEYDCFFRNDCWNEIDIKAFIANSIYESSCLTQRLNQLQKPFQCDHKFTKLFILAFILPIMLELSK